MQQQIPSAVRRQKFLNIHIRNWEILTGNPTLTMMMMMIMAIIVATMRMTLGETTSSITRHFGERESSEIIQLAIRIVDIVAHVIIMIVAVRRQHSNMIRNIQWYVSDAEKAQVLKEITDCHASEEVNVQMSV